jgi:hypothetical protein
VKKEDFINPDENWLFNQFQSTPFGIIRPAEMETLLAFFIIHHNGRDIEEPEEVLAKKYKITETKAKRMKIEFAVRYKRNVDPNTEVAAIIGRLFLDNQAPFELDVENKAVRFMVKDPYELKVIKQNLEDNRIVYQGDFVGKLIKLSLANFMRFMNVHYAELQKKLKKFINEKLTEAEKNSNEFGKALSLDKKAKLIAEKIAPSVLNGIISLVTGLV